MSLKEQLLSLIFSFIYGIIAAYLYNINYKFLYKTDILYKILINFLFVTNLFLLYFILLSLINNGIIHFYLLLVSLISFLIFSKKYQNFRKILKLRQRTVKSIQDNCKSKK